MSSDIALRPSLRQKEWTARKTRIGAGLGEIGSFVLRKVKDILPDIRAIKEKELWREGDYASFEDFLRRMVGVSRSHIYRLLKEDSESCKVLEISESQVSLWDNSGAPRVPVITSSSDPHPVVIEAPKKPAAKPVKQAKARVIGTEPNLPMHTTQLPDVTKRCPHCGQPLP